ncbi:MAG: site-specific integrase [Solirubrobacteraceae bacterium]
MQIDRLWRRGDVAIREKALWRLLYETAARASEVLSLNVEDLDLENRRAVVRSKVGDVELLHFRPARRGCCPGSPACMRSSSPAPCATPWSRSTGYSNSTRPGPVARR